jgi:hypothetical protein
VVLVKYTVQDFWGPNKTFLHIFKVIFRKYIYIFGKSVMFFEGIVGIVGEC